MQGATEMPRFCFNLLAVFDKSNFFSLLGLVSHFKITV